MPQFDPTYFVSQIFWLIVCFAVLVAVVGGVVVPRIQSGINSRSRYLQDMKDKEVAYLDQIDELTKHMNHLKHTHEETCHHMLDSAHHAFIMEKEQALHKLSERFALQRQDMYVDIAQDMTVMKEKIPDLAKELTQGLLKQFLRDTSMIERKKHHAIH